MNRNTDPLRVFEVADEEDQNAEVILESTSQRVLESLQTSGPIVFLNEDDRVEAGCDDDIEVIGEEEVVVEKYIQKNVEVQDDEENDDFAEIVPIVTTPKETVIKSSEVQEDEPAVLFERVVKNTPNRELQAARLFENELIYLNETQDSPDNLSVASDAPIELFASPTPDDSVSRSQTPCNQTFSSSLFPYSSNSVRDYWRKTTTTTKKPIMKRAPVRTQLRGAFVQKISHSKIQKNNKIRNSLLSRDFLLQGVVASGQYKQDFDVREIERILNKQKKTPATDVLSQAKNVLADIKGSGSNTPSVLSRDSSIIFDRTVTGSQRSRQTPSTSSDHSSICPNQIDDVLSKIHRLNIKSANRGAQRYQTCYHDTKEQEDDLQEEARIREGHREQTKGDRMEEIRKKLEIEGISIRPKEKKKVDYFVELPESADVLVGKAWSKNLNSDEEFVNAFNIPICRKDLLSLSGLHWLNDNVINFYLQLVCNRSQNDSKYPKVFAFNTFFYTNVVTKGYASVKRWTRKVDIFSHDVVLIPVHLGMHWCMAVVDFGEKKLEFYDSLYNGNTVVLPALKEYLASESLDKKKTTFDFSGWTIRQLEDIPRQENGSDCGVFSCQFGEWASRRTTPAFSQKNMPYYRRRMVYEIVSQKLLSTI